MEGLPRVIRGEALLYLNVFDHAATEGSLSLKSTSLTLLIFNNENEERGNGNKKAMDGIPLTDQLR